MKSKKRNDKGIALLLALIIMVILFMLSTTYLSSMLSESGIARNQENSEKAFFLAEAGIDRGMRLIVETPDVDTMPWSYQENMSDGYYTLDISEATDLGSDYVRILATGYAGKAQRTSEAIIYLCAWKFLLFSNTNITFADTAVGSLDGDIHANQSVFGLGIDAGFYYIDGTRQANTNQNVRFSIRNATGAPVNLTQLTANWSSPSAYYSEITVNVSGGTNYGTVWDRFDNGGDRLASGELAPFDEVVVIPNMATAQIRIESFKRDRTGWFNPNRDMDNTTFNISFSDGTDFYPVTVNLASGGAASELDIDGVITEGSKGDPIVTMPVVDMAAYRARADHVIDGDYVFNGYDRFVDFELFGTCYYLWDSYYCTGKVTINTFYNNLNFPQCMITAEGGIEIVNEYQPSGVDYIELSRRANTNSDVEFQIRNNTDSAITITRMSIGWDLVPLFAAYEYIDSRVEGQGSFTRNWSYTPPSGRAGNGDIVNLNPAITLAPGQYADIQFENFNNFSFGLGSRDMDNEVFNLNMYTPTGSYQTIVFRSGETITPSGGRLYFRRWSPQYPTIITKDGDITETGAFEANDRDFDGILYSQNGTIDIENFEMDGCMVANNMIFKQDLDLEYRPIMVPDPPPDFIAGLSFIKWQENY
jgi:hypothetical protein